MTRRHWLVSLLLVSGMVVLLAGIAGVVALRRWPERVAPKLPPLVALLVSGVAGAPGRNAIGERLSQVDAEGVVMAELGGNRRRKLAICELLSLGSHGWSDNVEERLYHVANESDNEVRTKARSLTRNGAGKRLMRHVYAPVWPAPTRPISPDGWIPSVSASKALVVLVFAKWGNDHRMPSRYRKRIAHLLDGLLTGQDQSGSFALDPRDHALITSAVAELFAMSKDKALVAPLERAMQAMRNAWPETGAAGLWTWDTTLTMSQLGAWEMLALGGLDIGDALTHFAIGFDPLGSGLDPDPIRFPWYASGKEVVVKPWQSLGSALGAAAVLDRMPALQTVPASRLDPQGEDIISDALGYWWGCGIHRRGGVDAQDLLTPRQEDIRARQLFVWRSEADGGWAGATAGDSLVISAHACLVLQLYYRRSPVVKAPTKKP